MHRIGGWWGSPTGKSFRVVPCVRACVRAHGLVAQVVFHPNRIGPRFPFPFERAGLALFPCASGVSFCDFYGFSDSCDFYDFSDSYDFSDCSDFYDFL